MKIGGNDVLALVGIVFMLAGVYFWLGWAAMVALIGVMVFLVAVLVAAGEKGQNG